MKIRQFKVNNKYLLISIWALLIIIVAHFSYPYVKAYRLNKEVVDLEKKLKEYLARHPEIENKLSKNKKAKILLTDITKNIQKLSQKWFGSGIKPELVKL